MLSKEIFEERHLGQHMRLRYAPKHYISTHANLPSMGRDVLVFIEALHPNQQFSAMRGQFRVFLD